jgi:hypothetical protein
MISYRLYYINLLVRAAILDVMTLLRATVAHTFVDLMIGQQNGLFFWKTGL